MAGMPTSPPTPKGLSRRAQRLWRDVTTAYRIDADGLATLEVACRCLGRLQAAEEIIAAEGLMATGSAGQPVPHPAILIADRERNGYLRCIRLLGLEGQAV